MANRIGIDVGSTYTKYCVMNEGVVESLYMEKTPVHQQAYFQNKIKLWRLWDLY